MVEGRSGKLDAPSRPRSPSPSTRLPPHTDSHPFPSSPTSPFPRSRYHEEQLWSDKLRSFSTYVSVSVMVANLLVFITAIVFVEPYKRKRLALTFEERVTEMTAQVETRIENGVGRILLALEEEREKKEGEGLVEKLKKRVAGGGATSSTAITPSVDIVESPPPPLPSAPTPPTPIPTASPPLPKPYTPLIQTLTFSSLPSFPTTLPTLTSQTPHDILLKTQDLVSETKDFVEKGWEGEGRERDLMVVAGGGVMLGGGLIWALLGR